MYMTIEKYCYLIKKVKINLLKIYPIEVVKYETF